MIHRCRAHGKGLCGRSWETPHYLNAPEHRSSATAFRLPPILSPRRGGRLPLRVGNRVGSAAGERDDMIFHVAGACAGRAARLVVDDTGEAIRITRHGAGDDGA